MTVSLDILLTGSARVKDKWVEFTSVAVTFTSAAEKLLTPA